MPLHKWMRLRKCSYLFSMSTKAITLQISLFSMPTAHKPRIVLDPQALKAIQIWSTVEDKDPGDLISELILEHMPSRVQDALGLDQSTATKTKTLKPTEPPKPAATNKRETDTKCHLETEMLECEPEPKKPPKNKHV